MFMLLIQNKNDFLLVPIILKKRQSEGSHRGFMLKGGEIVIHKNFGTGWG